MKKAFTLGEMLISLAVLAAIIAILMSTIRVKPNSSMVMFRKAYNIATNTIYDMMQTHAYYEREGLDDLSSTSQKVGDENPNGVTKFCKIFVNYINTAGEASCGRGSGPSFSTLDGIDWYLPPKTTAGTFALEGETIKVDVNGKDNPPNCSEDMQNCKDPDIFIIKIAKTGKIQVPGKIAQSYLQNAKRISK